MADINRVVLVGRLTRDAELRYSSGGMAICAFSIAVNNARKQGDEWIDEPSFFDVTVFGRQGEAIQRYLTKGREVGVDGKLKQDRWQNQDGQNRSKVVIIGDNVRLLGSGGGGSAGGSGEPRRGGADGSPEGNRYDNGRRGGAPEGDDFPDQIPF